MITQAALHLLSRVTRRHPVALRCLADGGPRLLLSLPRACLLPGFAHAEPSIVAVLLNVLEDPLTLEAWMEAEIRGFFSSRARRGSYAFMPHPRGGSQPGVSQVGFCVVKYPCNDPCMAPARMIRLRFCGHVPPNPPNHALKCAGRAHPGTLFIIWGW